MPKKRSDLKRIFITGCSSGIGQECANVFLKNSWEVVVTVRTKEDQEKWKNVKGITCFLLDITQEDQFSYLEKELILENKKFDILLNNAGISRWGPLLELEDQAVRDLFETNFLGTRRVLKLLFPFLKREAKILAIGSISVYCLLPFMGAYPLSKLALQGMFEILTRESSFFSEYQKFQFSVITPGTIETPMWHKAFNHQYFVANTKEKLKILQLGKILIQEELKNAPKASWIAEKIFTLSLKKKIKKTYAWGNWCFVFKLLSFFPDCLTNLFVNILKFKYRKILEK